MLNSFKTAYTGNTKTILFCPKSLAETLETFSKAETVALNSHKCYYRQNQHTGLWEMSISENTYGAIFDRTYRNTYKMIAGGTVQSVDMLIHNLGAFHLAIETMIRDKLVTDSNRDNMLQGVMNLRTIYEDRRRLLDYLDIVIIPLFDKNNTIISTPTQSEESE